MLTQAVDGVVTARFESLHPLLPQAYPGEVRPSRAFGEPVEPEDAWAVCFALLERHGRLAFRRRWLDDRVPTYRIPDPRAPGRGH